MLNPLKTNKPFISCIIPTFNRASLLKEAIESTIHQTFENWELIVVDDGSSDNTEKIVNEFILQDHRIIYYKNDKKGQASARNYGLFRSNGQYIAFLDDDDISLPNRFESQLGAAYRSGSRFIVSGYQVRNRKTGRIISEHKLELRGAGSGFPSRWLIDKELLDKVGGFDEKLSSMEEVELSYRLSALETFALHDDIVTILYPTENSVSHNKANNVKGMVLMLERVGSNMDPEEAAWWYFNIGAGYYATGDRKNSLAYFKKAAYTSESQKYRFCYLFADYSPTPGSMVKRINLKILQKIGNRRFPFLVNHSVIK
jgi:glycosyltransferase involved in cell wall biosynthesis